MQIQLSKFCAAKLSTEFRKVCLLVESNLKLIFFLAQDDTKTKKVRHGAVSKKKTNSFWGLMHFETNPLLAHLFAGKNGEYNTN